MKNFTACHGGAKLLFKHEADCLKMSTFLCIFHDLFMRPASIYCSNQFTIKVTKKLKVRLDFR